MRLHVQIARQACTDGGIGKGRAGGRALQGDTGLGRGRRYGCGEECDGQGALGDALLLLAPGHGAGSVAVKGRLGEVTTEVEDGVVHGGQYSSEAEC